MTSITEWLSDQKKLLEAATPGPWLQGSWSGQCHLDHFPHGRGICKYDYTLDTDNKCIVSTAQENVELIGFDDYGPILNEKNAAFIASVRTEHARALKIIEKCREALETITPITSYYKNFEPYELCLDNAEVDLRKVNEALAYFPDDSEVSNDPR